MKSYILIAIFSLLVNSMSDALEESTLISEFALYEKSIQALTDSTRNRKSTVPEDEVIVKFVINVYGDFMGHNQIKSAWNFLISQENEIAKNPLTSDLEKWIAKWNRKSILSFFSLEQDLSEADKNIANKILSRLLPDYKELEAYRSDEFIVKLIKMWSAYELYKSNEHVITYELKEVFFKKEMINVDLESSITKINISDGSRITANDTKMATVKGGIFTGISDSEITSAKWMNLATVGKAFGHESIIWKNVDAEGGIQTFKGARTEEGLQTYFIFFKGYMPPTPSMLLKDLDANGVSTLSLRASSALSASFRNNELIYKNSENLSRYSSQVGVPKLIELLETKKLSEKEIEFFVFLNAGRISKEVFLAYPKLEAIFTKYK